MKKVFKYISLVLLMFLGLIACGLLLIFFVPNLTIFNITNINYNKTINNWNRYDKDKVDVVIVKSKHFDIEVIAEDRETFDCVAYANTFGYALKQNSDFELYENLEDGVLTYEIIEPFGAAFINNSNIKIFVPKDYAVAYSFENNSSNLIINNDVEILNLNYKTTNGSFKLGKDAALSGQLLADINNGQFEISNDSKISNLDVEVALEYGKFVSYENINEFKLLNSENSVISLAGCSKFICNSNCKADVTINDIDNYLEVKSTDVNLKINSVKNIVANMTGSGNIAIEEITGTADLQTNSGYIIITKSTSVLSLSSNSGMIWIKEAHNQVYANNNSGDVNIYFEQDDDLVKNGYANVKMNGGRLVVYNAKNINAELKGSAYAVCLFNNLQGSNSITTENGSITVNIPAIDVFKLTTKTGGDVKVNLLQIPEFGGYTTNEERVTYVNSTSENTDIDTLIVTSNEGSITIFDREIQAINPPGIAIPKDYNN